MCSLVTGKALKNDADSRLDSLVLIIIFGGLNLYFNLSIPRHLNLYLSRFYCMSICEWGQISFQFGVINKDSGLNSDKVATQKHWESGLNRGFCQIGSGRCETQRQTVELHCRLSWWRDRLVEEEDGIFNLLSPCCLLSWPVYQWKSLKLSLRVSGKKQHQNVGEQRGPTFKG